MTNEIVCDHHHLNISFIIGYLVMLKLRSFPGQSFAYRTANKPSKYNFGLFKIPNCIGENAYKLALPPDSKIHDIFYISLLKLY